MSVLACDRPQCDNVMCDRYSHKYGYLCNECYSELVESKVPTGVFMDTEKGHFVSLKYEFNYAEEFQIR